MNTKLTTTLSIIIILISVVAGMLVYDQMPDQMASHWGPDNQVNDYMGKFWGVFMTPLLAFGMLVLFLIVPHLDPLKENIAEFRNVFNLFILMIMLFFVYIWALTIFWNLGYTSFKMSVAILPAMGLLFFFIGYMLREAKRNWFIGIRTPWTLRSIASVPSSLWLLVSLPCLAVFSENTPFGSSSSLYLGQPSFSTLILISSINEKAN